VVIVWDNLQINGLGIYRDTEGFGYGHDAVLLSSFARFRKGEKILDIGTGTGILALLLHAKTGTSVDAIDISAECCTLAEKSIEKNALSDVIRVFHADLKDLPDAQLSCGTFDGVICNPPYHQGGTVSPNTIRASSTHQQECTFRDVAACAGRMLKNGGKACFCYPATGLSAFCAALENEGLSVKRIRFVRSRREKSPYLFLAEAKKGGGTGLILEDDMILEET